MENTDINISALENVDIDRILKEAIKEKIEKLMETELNAYLEENPGILLYTVYFTILCL